MVFITRGFPVRRSVLSAGSISLLFLTVFVPLAHASDATIVFCSDRDGDNELYEMDADGTNIIQLTFNDTEETGPMCSPDGRRIAFVTDRDGNNEIYILDLNSGEEVRLTDDRVLPAT